jgi:tyrosine-protein kinase Etk/Wzc
MKNGEYAVEEKKVATDREYTVWEILQGNLKVWWLMLFGALAGALLLGGYKYYSNRSFVSEKNYEDDYRVMASLMVEEYSGESAAERVGTVITVAESRSTYEKMKQDLPYRIFPVCCNFLFFHCIFSVFHSIIFLLTREVCF